MTPTTVGAADQWLTGVALEQSTVLFVIGQGGGDLSGALQRRGWNGKVIVVDPTRPLGDLERTLLSIEPDSENPVVAIEPEVARAHREASRAAARHIARAWFGARANLEAKRQNAGPYLLNSLRNVRAISAESDVAALVGVFGGLPGLIVAAGPSLDRNLADIAAFRDRVLLIAVDTALRPLLAAGVEPDLVVAVDPSEANACHLSELPPCPNAHFVTEGSIDPEALRHFAGRTFFFRVSDHHPWPWFRSLGLDRHQLRAWGSVLTTAFDLTLSMGCEPIVFAGADLAFTSGRPYARGTTYEESWRRAQAWGQSLDGIWADRVADWPETLEAGVPARALIRTAPHLRSFRDWIVGEAQRATGRTIINATEGGILVGGGVLQASLRQALADLPALAQSVPSTLARRRFATGGDSSAQSLRGVDEHVRADWMKFSGASAEAIADALQQRPTSAAPVTATPVLASHPVTAVARDAAFLDELRKTGPVELLILADPAQDLLAELSSACQNLAPDGAVVIVDDVGIGAGAQVRHATDALLCDRQDLSLEYRRFVDHESRLTVLRANAAQYARRLSDADGAKREPAHRAIADGLVPIIVNRLAPTSVVDVGCGAGFWLEAFKAQGVATLLGIPGETLAAIQSDLRFDICLCLEIAQRLSPADQHRLISSSVSLSDVVVFSSTPPGVPGSSPHDRPLAYWASMFWRHGYVLDDCLRPSIEHRWNAPRSVFDCLVTFRRQLTASQVENSVLREASMRSAARIHDLYLQTIWWAVAAGDRARPAVNDVPQTPMTWWSIPKSRILTADGRRVFRFRTDAARWYASHDGARLQVSEDGHPLPEVEAIAALSSADRGGWARWRDEVVIKASDGSDPRNNCRQYSVALPTHVAWAESQPFADTLRFAL